MPEIMNVYTDVNNIATLKLMIASKFGNKNLSLVYVQPGHEICGINRLPILKLDDNYIFSNTQATKYLFHKNDDKISDDINIWLEFDAIKIQPLLANGLIGNSQHPHHTENIMNILEERLQKTNFLGGDSVSVADIAVWCSLYPVNTDKVLCKQYLENKSRTLQWFLKISEFPQVKNTIPEWGDTNGLASIRSFIFSSWYPPPTQPLLPISKKEQISSPVVERLSSVTEEDITLVKEAWLHGTASHAKQNTSSKQVLPIENERNILVTSALPYVNNVPHLGNIIGCVLSADVFARYARLRNWNTLFICGTDEYGTATETKALEENLTPQEICDKYYAIHKSIYEWFNISFDYFGRTSTERQTEIVQELFLKIYNKGFTNVESMEQLLCEKCDRYLADRFVEGTCVKCNYLDARGDQCDGCGCLTNAVELLNPRCKLCQNTPVVRNSDQIFLNLPKIESDLRKWIEGKCDGWTANAKAITETWLKDGLKPRCITRDLKWGVPVPLDQFKSKVFYVWFDAPIGYMSITANYTNDWRQWWQPAKNLNITYYEFMAKDNVPFHSVMFPACLLAANDNHILVNHIMSTEYLNYEDGKFSKSRGIGVFGTDAKETGLSSDVFRFYLLYVRPETQDTTFDWDDLAAKHNNELINNLGNFTLRSLSFLKNFFNSIIPAMNLTNDDYHLLTSLTKELKGYNTAIEKGRLKDGIIYIFNISRYGNQLMQNEKPWVLVKGTQQQIERAGTVIGLSVNMTCLLTLLLRPYMPDTANELSKQLNIKESMFVLSEEINTLLQPGHEISEPCVLFKKIEATTVKDLKSRFSGKQKESKNNVATGEKNSTLAQASAVKKEVLEKAIEKQMNSKKNNELSLVIINDLKMELNKILTGFKK